MFIASICISQNIEKIELRKILKIIFFTIFLVILLIFCFYIVSNSPQLLFKVNVKNIFPFR